MTIIVTSLLVSSSGKVRCRHGYVEKPVCNAKEGPEKWEKNKSIGCLAAIPVGFFFVCIYCNSSLMEGEHLCFLPAGIELALFWL